MSCICKHHLGDTEGCPEHPDDKEVDKHYHHFYKGIRLDPYRICRIYKVGGGPREHIIKKLLRGTEKGHSEAYLIAEVEKSLARWKQMLEEDSES